MRSRIKLQTANPTRAGFTNTARHLAAEEIKATGFPQTSRGGRAITKITSESGLYKIVLRAQRSTPVRIRVHGLALHICNSKDNHMQNFTSDDFAYAIADHLIAERCSRVYGIATFSEYLDLIEMGADAAWSYDHKGADRRVGQVRTQMPFANTLTAHRAAFARLIVNAKTGQQARTLDRNPLNLRRVNLFLVGNPIGIEGRKGRAKTDTRAQLAGQDYGMGADDDSPDF